MKITPWILILLLVATAVSAGEPDKQCTAAVDDCLTMMVENLRQKGWLGVELEWDGQERPLLKRILAESPAARAGLEPGDVLISANGVSFGDPEVKKLLRPDAVLALEILRRGKPLRLEVDLVPVPEYILAQWVGEHMIQHHQRLAEQPPEEPASPAGTP